MLLTWSTSGKDENSHVLADPFRSEMGPTGSPIVPHDRQADRGDEGAPKYELGLIDALKAGKENWEYRQSVADRSAQKKETLLWEQNARFLPNPYPDSALL